MEGIISGAVIASMISAATQVLIDWWRRRNDKRRAKEESYVAALNELRLQNRLLLSRHDPELVRQAIIEAMSADGVLIELRGGDKIVAFYNSINEALLDIVERVIRLTRDGKTDDPEETIKIKLMHRMLEKQINKLAHRMRADIEKENIRPDEKDKCPGCGEIVSDHEGCSRCKISYVERIFYDNLPDVKERVEKQKQIASKP